MQEFIVPLTCGHCDIRGHFFMTPVKAAPRLSIQTDSGRIDATGVLPPDAEGRMLKAAAGGCPACGGATMITYRIGAGEALQGHALKDMRQFPAPPDYTPPAIWPEDLATAWTDSAGTRNAALSPAGHLRQIGACLELALNLLDARGPRLINRIDDLRARNIITQTLADWAHHLRVLRNDAAHEHKGTAAEAREAFEFLQIFLHLTFTLPAQIARHRATPG